MSRCQRLQKDDLKSKYPGPPDWGLRRWACSSLLVKINAKKAFLPSFGGKRIYGTTEATQPGKENNNMEVSRTAHKHKDLCVQLKYLKVDIGGLSKTK